ncbi:MAG: hypothetical protein ACOZE5_17090 [Verrucomicrobiota bacterium]
MTTPRPTIGAQFKPGTRALFRILRENDAHRAMFRNTGWWAALAGIIRVRRDPDILMRPTSSAGAAPACFLEWVTVALMEFRARQAAESPPERLGARFVSDFDVHAFQAVASAFAEICWPDRRGLGLAGPTVATCTTRLGSVTEANAGWLVAQHYVGNLLQWCFSDAKIRQQVRTLPLETETELRTIEALRFVELTRSAAGEPPVGDPAEFIWMAMGEFWDNWPLAER